MTCITLRLTLFETFAVKCEKSVFDRPKIVNRVPFLTPYLEAPKDIATKGQTEDLVTTVGLAVAFVTLVTLILF